MLPHLSAFFTNLAISNNIHLLAPHVKKKSCSPTCSNSFSSSSSLQFWIEMGCGTSTLLSDNNAAIQDKVRPIIRRRIDDIKRRRDIQKGSTPSKKELLAVEDSLGSTESKSLPTEDSVDLKSSSKIVPVLEEAEEGEEEEELGSTVYAVESRKKIEVEEKHDAEETESENEDELDLEEHDDEEDDGRCISPGSPSFRFYCVEAVLPDNDTDDDDEQCHTESPEKQEQETEPIEEEHPALYEPSSAAAEPPHQERNPETRNNRKRKINRKFRSVIQKGGQVKSLLKVKSCYNPMCSGTNHGHDKAHLLREPAAAA